MEVHSNPLGNPGVIVLYVINFIFKIHNICSYSQTRLSVMSLIKVTHLVTGFNQT